MVERWAGGSTGRPMYNVMKNPDRNDNINRLRRKEQSTIFRLRTEHIALNNHLNRLNLTQKPNSRNCTHPFETVQHVLLECPTLTTERRKLLPASPTIENTLYGTTQQLKNTCKFLALAAEERQAQQH